MTTKDVAAVKFLDEDSKGNDNNNKKTKERRSSVSTETESVEVFIYRRTSMVTSSNGSILKVDQNTMRPLHDRIETGLNLWDATSRSQSHPVTDDGYDYTMDALKQHKSRNSVDVSSVIFHENIKSATDEEASQTDELEMDHAHYEASEPKNTSTKLSKSTMLEMTGTPFDTAVVAPNMNRQNEKTLDERFFLEIQKSITSDPDAPHSSYEQASKGKPKKTRKLTEQNLMVHDSIHSLHAVEEIGGYNTDGALSNGLRYIDVTDEENKEERRSGDDMKQSNHSNVIAKQHKAQTKMKLSTKIKYVTAIGAICAVTLLIGVVIYSNASRQRRSPYNRNAASEIDVLIMPKTRRRPPRI